MSLSPAGPPSVLDRAKVAQLIDDWSTRQVDHNPVVAAVDHDPDQLRWYVRLLGEEKSVITVWMTLGQRNLRTETYMMPAPETNVGATYEYLLRRNATLSGMHFALGPEDAVYLVGRYPLESVDGPELDRILGAAYSWCDDSFPIAMAIGYAGKYHRPVR